MATYDGSFGTGNIIPAGDHREYSSGSSTDYAAQQLEIDAWMGKYHPTSALTGGGTLTATGEHIVAGGGTTYDGLSALTGGASLTATGSATYNALSALSGSGLLTATGLTTFSGLCALTGGASLTASGAVGGNYDGSFGTGDITAESGHAEFKSDSLTDYAAQQAQLDSWMEVTTTYDGVSALTGGASLTASGSTTYSAVASFTGAGELYGGTRDGYGSGLYGTGLYSSTGGVTTYDGLCALTGGGSLTATGSYLHGVTAYPYFPDGGTETFGGAGTYSYLDLIARNQETIDAGGYDCGDISAYEITGVEISGDCLIDIPNGYGGLFQYSPNGGTEAFGGSAVVGITAIYLSSGGDESFGGSADESASYAYASQGGDESFGGTAGIATTTIYLPDGGDEAFGGTATEAASFAEASAGGDEAFGGTALESISFAYTPTGGTEAFGGTATVVADLVPTGEHVFASDGGTEAFGGSASINNVWDYPGSGGLVEGGTAKESVTASESGSGGGVFAGSADESAAFAGTVAGGGVFGGTADESIVYVGQVSGGGVFGGVGTYSYIAETSFDYVGSGGGVFGGGAFTRYEDINEADACCCSNFRGVTIPWPCNNR